MARKPPTNRYKRAKRAAGQHSGQSGESEVHVAETMRQAVELRRAGHSYRTIAAELGCNVATAYKRVRQALADIPKEAADELRTIEQDRLDTALERLEPAALEGDVRAIAEQRLIGESRRRLLGLDAPSKGEMKVTTELPDDVAALKERLAKLLEGGHDQATAADRDPGHGAGGPAPGAGLVGQDEPQRGPVGSDPDP
jgi:hypothetical protein